MENIKTNNTTEKEITEQSKNLPEKFKTPQLIQLSHSANLPDLECLAQRGASCTWK